jgi:hypothetical protein
VPLNIKPFPKYLPGAAFRPKAFISKLRVKELDEMFDLSTLDVAQCVFNSVNFTLCRQKCVLPLPDWIKR